MKRSILHLTLLLVVSICVLRWGNGLAFGEEYFKIPDTATAKSIDGKTVSLADHRGKVVFLNIWRTDCIGCLFELPLLNRLQKEYSSDDFTVIGLSVDRGKDKFVARFAEERKLAYPVWMADEQPITRYIFAKFLPTLFAIGPAGEVLFYHEGAFLNYEEAVATLDEARRRAEKAGRAE